MRGRRGFTLLEAVVALVVVGLAATSALGAFAADARAVTHARQALVAETLARQRLAVLELAASEGAGAGGRLPDSLARGSFASPLDGYGWISSAQRVPGEPGLLALHVEVSWAGGRFAVDSRWFVERGGSDTT